jgi:uncharacterized membrane protein YgdD (TMEM256/DUF423 family)
MNRFLLMVAALLGFLAVGLGAFGAHALEAHFAANPTRQPTYETAVQYQMFHVVGLLAAAYLSGQTPGRLPRLAGWLFVAGTVLFSGSLYILAVFQIGVMGAVAPLGGVSLLVGWALLGLAGWQQASS